LPPFPSLTHDPRHLRPGGWVEFEDITPIPVFEPTTSPPSPSSLLLTRFFSLINTDFAHRYGWSPSLPSHLPTALSSAGLVNVGVRRERLPLGPRPRAKSDAKTREVALYMQLLVDGLVAGVLAKHRELDLTGEEAEVLAKGVEAAVRDPGVCGFLWWTSVWAQKPG